jgi:hypothetical protein
MASQRGKVPNGEQLGQDLLAHAHVLLIWRAWM